MSTSFFQKVFDLHCNATMNCNAEICSSALLGARVDLLDDEIEIEIVKEEVSVLIDLLHRYVLP